MTDFYRSGELSLSESAELTRHEFVESDYSGTIMSEPQTSRREDGIDLELVVTELFRAVDTALRDEFEAAREIIHKAASLLRLEGDLALGAPSTTAARATSPLPSRSGLAPWQVRKVRLYIQEHIETAISTSDLAAHVRLSPFHFSRAFKDTFGDSPHRFVLRKRIAHAQNIMLTTNKSLAQIALQCGLVDQAHFGRIFRRLMGETPAAWRRARVFGS